MRNYSHLLIALGLIAVAIVSRTILHVPNFAAMAAIGLFSGFFFRGIISYIIPLVAVFISDLFIGFYELPTMIFVYLAWMFPVLLGKWNLQFKGIRRILSNTFSITFRVLLASLSFFIISNLGVWLFSGMYLKTFNGLVECYILAIPFFRMTIMGDLLFSGIIFGSYNLIEYLTKDKEELKPVYIKNDKS